MAIISVGMRVKLPGDNPTQTVTGVSINFAELTNATGDKKIVSRKVLKEWIDTGRVEVVIYCNCESSYCGHGDFETYVPCRNPAFGNWSMLYVGPVCEHCARSVIANGGSEYIQHINPVGKVLSND